ncbi:MAG: hypothetical protein LC775_18300, partial [Acidobacteria bacterium]|nr:hypothetical protein [Acidobacteriota bacterium]
MRIHVLKTERPAWSGPYCRYQFVFNGERVPRPTKQGNPPVARQIDAAHKRDSLSGKGEVGIAAPKKVSTLR